MMKIVFDNIIFWLQRSGGGSVYWTELIKRFNKINSNDISFFDQVEPTNNIFRNQLELNNLRLEKKFKLRLRRYLPFTEKINQKSIFHSSYFRISNSHNAINVTTIHDFTTEKFRKGLPRWVNLTQKKIAVEKAKGVICISENTKKDLLHFFPKTDPKKIKVIYNGVSDDFFLVDPDFLISKKNTLFSELENYKYLLYIGHRTKYKNFELAVKAASRFKEQYKLVVVGEKFSSQEESFVNRYFDKKQIIIFTGLSNTELNFLYNKAFALLYPSSYEGFGIPIVEAMKTKCPVIASNNSSIPEVAGSAALLYKDINEDKIINGIQQLQNIDFRNKIISQGLLQSKKFSWDKTFEEYLAYYKKLYYDEV